MNKSSANPILVSPYVDKFQEPYTQWLKWAPSEVTRPIGSRGHLVLAYLPQMAKMEYFGKTVWTPHSAEPSWECDTTTPERRGAITRIPSSKKSDVTQYLFQKDPACMKPLSKLREPYGCYSEDGTLQKIMKSEIHRASSIK